VIKKKNILAGYVEGRKDEKPFREFPAGAREFSLSLVTQTGSGAYPTSYSGTGALSSEENGHGVKLPIHLHVGPRPRMVELYLHSLIRLHGVMLTKVSRG
jgi:hypothetical protein